MLAADCLNQERMKAAQPITFQLLISEQLAMAIFENFTKNEYIVARGHTAMTSWGL